ncbi:MAG: Asr1405/Asl0597 family protein [Phormidesmis sp.]
MSSTITVSCDDRWQVYHRLQELDIECQCSCFQALQVNLQSPTEALQLWSIVRRISKPRLALVEALQQSLRVPYSKQ